MTVNIHTRHGLNAFKGKYVHLTYSNKTPVTMRAMTALFGLIGLHVNNPDRLSMGTMDDGSEEKENFVAIGVHSTNPSEKEYSPPDFVVIFKEAGILTLDLYKREERDRPKLVEPTDETPFSVASSHLLLLTAKSKAGVTNYIVVPTTPISLAETVLTALVGISIESEQQEPAADKAN